MNAPQKLHPQALHIGRETRRDYRVAEQSRLDLWTYLGGWFSRGRYPSDLAAHRAGRAFVETGIWPERGDRMITVYTPNPLPELVETYRRASHSARIADHLSINGIGSDEMSEIAQRNDTLAENTRHQFAAQLERMCGVSIEDIRRML